MTPFYLEGKGQNSITVEEIKAFLKKAPELSCYFKNKNIELKTLNLPVLSSLCFWVTSQQISSIAAEHLIRRFSERFEQHHEPEYLSSLSIVDLRQVGLSEAKSQTVIRLGSYFCDNKNHQQKNLTSDAMIAELCQVKGVGEWTAKMHLIFNEGALDINAVNDLVVRKGLAQLYLLKEIPDIKTAKALTLHWGDLATIGTLLCWKMMEV